ncbi:MAG: LysR family transcriptional regulator [Pseudomonadota bacterium]
MDIRHLRYFVTIAEQGSLSKAAERLHVAQPALSQHVRNMERDLRTELLFRTSRGVQLTEAGQRLLQQSRHLIDQFDQLEEVVRAEDVEPSGEVRFGVPGTVSQMLSARLIQEASRRYPAIRLRIAEAMSGFIFDWLREDKIDVAVLYRGMDSRGIRLKQVLSEELRLFGPSDAKLGTGRSVQESVDFSEAISLPLAIPSRGHGLRDLLDDVASQHCGRTFEAHTEIDSYAPIKTLVEEGLAFSILPAMAIKTECQQGRLVSWSITNPELRRNIFISVPADRPKSAATLAIETLCHELLQQLVQEGTWEARLEEDHS